MSQENSVSFKVFLQQDGSREVRRFGIDRDVVSNFGYLREKLQTVFPSLRDQKFIVSWKDNEGDDIVISSDDELIIALTEQQIDVHKLYVTVSASGSRQNSSEGSRLHMGVQCDGCDKQVLGFRYKCIQCPDFDLCTTCESKNLHAEHYMIRMPVPTSWRPHFGRRLAHHLSKSAFKANYGGLDSGECPFKPHGGKYHGKRVPEWMVNLINSVNAWTKDEQQSNGEEGGAGPSCSKEKNQNDHVQFLRNVGQTVASFLDPLGIDVDVEVETRDVNGKTTKASEEKKTNGNPEKVNGETDQTNAMDVDDKQDKEPHASPPRSVDAPEGWTVLNKDSPQQNMNKTHTITIPFEIQKTTAETGAIPRYSPPANNDANPSTRNMYPNLPAGNNVPFATAPMYPRPINVDVPQIPPIMMIPQVLHPNPLIADALDKMMSMGFSNDGGWLTQLLESQNGDIHKALDMLQPVKKK